MTVSGHHGSCMHWTQAGHGLKVPGCGVSAAGGGRCRMGATPRGDYICTGNDSGGVFVFDTATGSQIAHVSPIRVRL